MGYTKKEITASLTKDSEYGSDVYAAYLIVGRRSLTEQPVKLKLPDQLNGYELYEKIGSGSFGKVMLAKHKRTGERVAIKVIDKIIPKKKKSAKSFEKFLNALKREVEIMKMLDHPNIVELYQVYETENKLYLVMEYSCGADMYDYFFDTPGPFSEKEARNFYRQLLSALEYLHRKKIVHRDIKPRNILLDESQKNIKLADFGVSEVFVPDQNLTTYVGSLRYMAPEILNNIPLDGPKADLWSSGVILYLFMTGSFPFDGENVKMKISEVNYEIPENVPKKCKDLLRKILVKESERHTLEGVMNNEWVNEGLNKFKPYPEPDPRLRLEEKHRRIKALEVMGYKKGEIKASLTKGSEYDNDVYAAYLIVGRRSTNAKNKKLPGLKRMLRFESKRPSVPT